AAMCSKGKCPFRCRTGRRRVRRRRRESMSLRALTALHGRRYARRMATPSRAPEPRRFTREEYYRMYDAGLFRDERVELLDGEIIAMSPQNSPHASSVNRINALLIPMLRKQYSVRCQAPIHLDRHSEPEPDLAICTYDPDDYESGHPTPEQIHLLIEVSDAS